MNLVIGSGPAGIACAHGLLAQGESVTLIDAGLTLELPQREALARLQNGFEQSAFDRLTQFHSKILITKMGIPLKTAYGSDYSYREADERLGLKREGTGLMASLAVGGLSTVWGATALPYAQRDIADWPITQHDLAAHYEAVLKTTGLTAKVDDLAATFPLYTERPIEPRLSSQASRFLGALDADKSGLNRDGIIYGRSRLMVSTGKRTGQSCVFCGQCLYGCPYELIYNSGNEIASLMALGGDRFKYETNLIVERVKESGTGVEMGGTQRFTGESVTMPGDRAFLAAGVIPTAKIVLNSLDHYDRTVNLLDSQYFLFPIVSLRGNSSATTEELQTLSQLFLEINDAEISPFTVHLQAYTYSDIVTKTLLRKFWFLPVLRNLLVRNLDHRIIIVQGYLHSSHSGHMEMRLTRDAANPGKDQFTVRGVPGAETRQRIRKVIRKLAGHLTGKGYFPVEQALEISEPGRSFHSGGSFPMRNQPRDLETDKYGRVAGQSRIHLADASTFPSIPTTTITLTAMANAHRIAVTSPR